MQFPQLNAVPRALGCCPRLRVKQHASEPSWPARRARMDRLARRVLSPATIGGRRRVLISGSHHRRSLGCDSSTRAASVFLLALAPIPARAQSTFIVRDVRLFDGERVTEHRSVVVRDGVIAQVGDAQLAVPAGAHGRRREGTHPAARLDRRARPSLRRHRGRPAPVARARRDDRSRHVERRRAVRADQGAPRRRRARRRRRAHRGHRRDRARRSSVADGRRRLPDDHRPGRRAGVRRRADRRGVGLHQDHLRRSVVDGPEAADARQAHAEGAHRRGACARQARRRARPDRVAGARRDRGGRGRAGASLRRRPPCRRISRGSRRRTTCSSTPTLTALYGDCGEAIGARIANDSLLRPYIRPAMRRQAAMSFPPTKGASCEGTREAVRQLVRAGVPILAGTDAPGPGSTYGASVHGELELLVGAGLTPVQALTAATSAPARAFRLADRGMIAPGKRADLVLVDGDPTTDIARRGGSCRCGRRECAVERVRYPEQ